jgi:nicotinate-nucleotide adenylyltransferase
MQRLGIFGGTFDPPHIAHLIAGELAVEQFQLERLLYVPAAISPHKKKQQVSSPQDRFSMLRLAIQDNSKFEVSDLEIKRGGNSYTIDTLHEIKEQLSPSALVLFIGRDQFEKFESWREPEQILSLAEVVVMDRVTSQKTSTKFDTAVRYLQMPLLQISSTEIRRRVKAGESIRYQVPDSVRTYIAEHKIYR